MQTLNSVKWDDAKNCLTKKAKIPDWSSYFPAVCLRGLNGKQERQTGVVTDLARQGKGCCQCLS